MPDTLISTPPHLFAQSGFATGAGSRTRSGGFGRGGSGQSHLKSHEHDLIRRDAYSLYRNNALCQTLVQAHATTVCGPGLSITPRTSSDEFNAQVRREMRRITEGVDHAGERTLEELVEQADIAMLLAGDCAFVKVDGGRHQWVDSELIANPNGRANDEMLADGLALASPGGAVKTYHIAEWQGSGSTRTRSTREIDASFVAYFANPFRVAGQRRGHPLIHAAREAIDVYERSEQAVRGAYELAAKLAIIRTRGPDSPEMSLVLNAGETSSERDTRDASDAREASLGPLSIIDLDDQSQLQGFQGAQPGTNYEQWIWTQIGNIAATIGLPLELTHFRFIRNYSASRSALAVAYRRFERIRACLARCVARPLYEWKLLDLIVTGRITAPVPADWREVEVVFPPQPMLDPAQWSASAERMLNNHFATHASLLRERGETDFAGFVAERAAEIETLNASGLGRVTPIGTVQGPQADAPDAPAADTPTDQPAPTSDGADA